MEEQEPTNVERDIRSLYDLGLILKAIESVLEIAGGIAVFFVSRQLVVRIVELATAGELVHDPHDFVANYLRTAAHAFALHAHYLLGGYLIVRGALKLGLITLILRGVQAAYPLFVIVLAVFASYEAYGGVLHSNLWLGVAAVFDTILIILTAYEYKRKSYSSSG